MKSIGWVPTGFTCLGNEFLLLYIEADANWTHFAVIQSTADRYDIGFKVSDRTMTGHQPAGITRYGDDFLYIDHRTERVGIRPRGGFANTRPLMN